MSAVTGSARSPRATPAGRQRAAPASRPLERSPTHLFTLLAGLSLVVVGWGAATLLDRSVAALSADLLDALEALPPWTAGVPEMAVGGGLVAALVAIPVWLVQRRRLRELVLVLVGVVVAAAASAAVGEAVRALARPVVQATFDATPPGAARWLPTDPSAAAAVGVLTMVRQSLPGRVRRLAYALVPVWLLAHLAAQATPPYLGVLLDVGVGMVAGSAVALLLRTPSLRPTAGAIHDGLANMGLEIVDLELAPVDARGSVPWFATTVDGRGLFIKALSHEQRLADLMFRLLRWLRLRRTGDPPPETSLRRAPEHEAFVAAHVRDFGIPTPTALTVADIGDENVALVYEAVAGRSLDRVPVDAITDEVMRQAWRHVRELHAHGVAHRDLRLANLFLAGDRLLLIDFGFAELSGSQHLRDVDVAELLAATTCRVGVARAVAVAVSVLGPAQVAAAEEWVHPLLLSRETGRTAERRGLLSPLREEIRAVTGLGRVEHEPPGRLHPQRLIGPTAVGITVVVLLTVLVGVESRTRGVVEPGLALAATIIAAIWYPAAAMAHRAASRGRTTLTQSLPSVLRSRLPVPTSTYWAHAVELLAGASPEGALGAVSGRRAASRWAEAAIAVAPALVGMFALAAARRPLGYLVAVVVAVGAGMAVVTAQAALRSATRWGTQLDKVWLARDGDDSQTPGPTATALWWAVALTAEAAAIALAVRSVGLDAPTESVMAMAVAVSAIARLVPTRGGSGVVEGLLLLALWVGSDLALSALAVIVVRLATYWAHIPALLTAQRVTRRVMRRRR